MAEVSETLKVKMLRTSGRNDTIQWFDYRPSFLRDIVRIEWELETMEVELDSPVADYLLRAGYAAPVPQGSAPVVTAVEESAPVEEPPVVTEEPSPPPSVPSWLKSSGDKQGE